MLKVLEDCRTSGDWRCALKLLDTCEYRNITLDEIMDEIVIEICPRMGSGRSVPVILSVINVDNVASIWPTVNSVAQLYLAHCAPKCVLDYILNVRSLDGVSISEVAYYTTMEISGTLQDAKSAKLFFEAIEASGESIIERNHHIVIWRCAFAV